MHSPDRKIFKITALYLKITILSFLLTLSSTFRTHAEGTRLLQQPALSESHIAFTYLFDPINNEWVGENKVHAPDIEIRQDAKSLNAGNDPQLERAVKEALLLLEKYPEKIISPPPFSTPALRK
jgi:hypothetical protein